MTNGCPLRKKVARWRREDLDPDIFEGHRSTTVTHLGNISYRVGQPASQAEIRERIAGVNLFEAMFDRMVEHLKAHEIDVDSPTITLGEWLEFATVAGSVIGLRGVTKQKVSWSICSRSGLASTLSYAIRGGPTPGTR
ncbi:MAG: hypothetical protein R6U98_25820 [Pirellulaceae bacterium]